MNPIRLAGKHRYIFFRRPNSFHAQPKTELLMPSQRVQLQPAPFQKNYLLLRGELLTQQGDWALHLIFLTICQLCSKDWSNKGFGSLPLGRHCDSHFEKMKGFMERSWEQSSVLKMESEIVQDRAYQANQKTHFCSDFKCINTSSILAFWVRSQGPGCEGSRRCGVAHAMLCHWAAPPNRLTRIIP